MKNKIYILLLSLLVIGCGKAQNNKFPMKVNIVDSLFFVPVDTSYSFIRYDKNHLILCSDSSQMRRFARKWYHLLSTGKGHLNIMQLGASHVQGGTFPHTMRRNLLIGACNAIGDSRYQTKNDHFPVGPRGMIFPYSAAVKCNNPFDYRVSRSWPLTLTRCVYKEPEQLLGLTGIAVAAADSVADISITLAEPDLDFATGRIIVLGNAVGGVVPKLYLVGKPGDTNWIAITDADPAFRRYTFEMPCAVDSFHLFLPCDSGQAFAVTGIYLDHALPLVHTTGITYHSIGVNGASVSDYLTKCPNFTTDLELISPDLVIFGIGINDAAGPNFDTAIFRQRYLQLVDSIRKVSPDCAFIFITNNDSYRHVKRKYVVNGNGPLVREAFLRVAEQCGGAVWDQFDIMGGLSSMDRWTKAELGQRDHVHFTRKGYTLLGDLLSNAIMECVVAMRPDVKTIKKAIEQPDNQKIQKSKKSDIPQNENLNDRPNYISY